MNLVELIKEKSETYAEEIISIRRHIHSNAELSLKEYNTSNYIKEKLNLMGIDIVPNISGTSLVGLIKGGKKGATIALRADMDALPIEEKNSIEYKSRNKGVMHACGHDGHVAMLLGTAMVLNSMKEELAGNVKLIFQSAEEQFGGAKTLIEDGCMDNPKVDRIYALHLWPDLPKGTIGIKEGCIMASNDKFEICLKGKTAHGAMPHLGKDALTTGIQIVNSLYNINSREINPLEPFVLTVGRFESGIDYNIVPSGTVIKGTVRTVKEATRDYVEKRLCNTVKMICNLNEVEARVDYIRQYPPTINNEEAVKELLEALPLINKSKDIVLLKEPYMTAEDFAYYLNETEGAMVFLGTKDEIYSLPLHHEEFNFDESVLMEGVVLMSTMALNSLKEEEVKCMKI